ncbi:MAG: hypothetical protein OHK0012_11520 [Synechococcales cyanobacterium]
MRVSLALLLALCVAATPGYSQSQPVSAQAAATSPTEERHWLPWALVIGGGTLVGVGGVAFPWIWKRWQVKHWQSEATRHLQAGELEAAETILKSAVAQNPAQVPFQLLLGDTLLKQRQFGEALLHYQAALSIEPENAQIQLLVAKALYERGQQSLGQAKLADAVKDFREAIAILPQRGAATGLAHFGIGWALIHYDDRGHWMQSINSLEAVSVAAPALAEASCAKAILDFRNGRFEEAIAACWQALENNESLAIAHHIMGQSYFRSGQTRAAISAYRIALSMSNPEDPFVPYMRTDLAQALIQTGELPAAEAELKRAQALAPDLIRTQWVTGLLLDAKGDYLGAAQRYELALKLNTNCLVAAAAAGLNYLTRKKLAADGGKRMIHIREVEASLRRFEQIISKDAQVAEAHFGLGEIARIRGGWVYAAQHYQAALAANGSYTEAHYRLGLVLARMNSRQDAIASFQRCLDIRPNHSEARASLNRLMGEQMVSSMTELVM